VNLTVWHLQQSYFRFPRRQLLQEGSKDGEQEDQEKEEGAFDFAANSFETFTRSPGVNPGSAGSCPPPPGASGCCCSLQFCRGYTAHRPVFANQIRSLSKDFVVSTVFGEYMFC
jgi:hypothetical protein